MRRLLVLLTASAVLASPVAAQSVSEIEQATSAKAKEEAVSEARARARLEQAARARDDYATLDKRGQVGRYVLHNSDDATFMLDTATGMTWRFDATNGWSPLPHAMNTVADMAINFLDSCQLSMEAVQELKRRGKPVTVSDSRASDCRKIGIELVSE